MRWVVVLVLAACASPKPAPATTPPPAEVENEVEPIPDRERLGWDEGRKPFLTDLLAELRATGERENFPKMLEFVVKVEALIRQAESGELSRVVLMERYEQLVVEMTDPIEDWVVLQLDDLRSMLRNAQTAPFDAE